MSLFSYLVNASVGCVLGTHLSTDEEW